MCLPMAVLPRISGPWEVRNQIAYTAVFIIIEPVDRAGVEYLPTEVLRASSHQLLCTDMLSGYDRVNSFEHGCRVRVNTR